MKPKTEELLYLLLWASEMVTRPTFRNLTDSFESWAYRNGFRPQLATLEKRQLLEGREDSAGDRVHRLTAAGRLLALGGRDPVARWKRRWDHKWRIVLFDVPQKKASDRVRLRRSLADRGFGWLQNSAWVTPDPLTDERDALRTGPVQVGTLLLMEGRPCGGERDEDIVAEAWNFEAINKRYDDHAEFLSSLPQQLLPGEAAAARLQRWLREERAAWNEAVRLDPLLPECLHPAGYRGKRAWDGRLKTMAEAGRQMRLFRAII